MGHTVREYALVGRGFFFLRTFGVGHNDDRKGIKTDTPADLNSSFWNEITILPREERCNNTILD